MYDYFDNININMIIRPTMFDVVLKIFSSTKAKQRTYLFLEKFFQKLIAFILSG